MATKRPGGAEMSKATFRRCSEHAFRVHHNEPLGLWDVVDEEVRVIGHASDRGEAIDLVIREADVFEPQPRRALVVQASCQSLPPGDDFCRLDPNRVSLRLPSCLVLERISSGFVFRFGSVCGDHGRRQSLRIIGQDSLLVGSARLA